MTFQAIRIEELEALAQSEEAFRACIGLEVEPGGVLPPEFVAGFLPQARLRRDWLGIWAIEDGKIIGSSGFKGVPVDGEVEIGYGVAPTVEGRGVATALALESVRYAFEHGAEAVIAHTLPDGHASQRVLAKVGMEFVGVFEDPEDGTVNRYRIRRPA